MMIHRHVIHGLIIGVMLVMQLGATALATGITISSALGDLWIENMDGTNGRWIYASSGYDHLPAFSPDGHFIAWVSTCNPYRDPECGDYEILVMAVDGAGGYAPDVGLLAISLPGDQSAPAWTSTGDLTFLDAGSPTGASVAHMLYNPDLPYWKQAGAIEPTTAVGLAKTIHPDARILSLGATDDTWHGSGILLGAGDTATVYIGGKPCADSSDPGSCGFQHLFVRYAINADGVRHDINVLEIGDGLQWRYQDPEGLDYAWTTVTAQRSGELEFGIWDPDGNYGNNSGTIIDGYNVTVLKNTSSDEGTAAVFRVGEAGAMHSDGTVYAAAFETGAADIAEWVLISEPLPPGTVIEFDPNAPRAYRASRSACSPLVAGVVSSAPGLSLGESDARPTSCLLALVGVVPTRVTNEGGSIRPGDLLVTSSTPGCAMRYTELDACPCTLVGKALEPMAGDRGIILVLLTTH
jgi:hypothetical protein